MLWSDVSDGALAVPRPTTDFWTEQNIEAVTTGSCHWEELSPIGLSRARDDLVSMPAELSYRRPFNWANAWAERAKSHGHLAQGIGVPGRPFRDAFRDLSREAVSLEHLDIADLRLWLEERVDGGEDRVAFMGLSFATGLLRSFGVLLVVAFQIYAMLHLAEISKRMAQSAPGDPAAFRPWIMLYSGLPARLASLGVISAAPVAASVVMVRLAEDGWFNSIEDGASLLGCGICALLFTATVVYCTRIRADAQRHRDAARGKMQTSKPSHGPSGTSPPGSPRPTASVATSEVAARDHGDRSASSGSTSA